MSEKKDFATIKKMASKKLLNLEQKKVLVKLFENKINQKEKKERENADKKSELWKINYVIQKKKTTQVTNLIKALELADKTIITSEKELEKLGLECPRTYPEDKRILRFSYKNCPRAYEELEEKQKEKLDKISELNFKLQADIYNLPMTYAEINSYIDNELSKI